MRIWIRRFAVTCTIAALLGAFAWVVLIEAFLASFAPNVLLQVLLPIGLVILAMVGWRLILALYKWVPNEPPTLANVS